MLSVSACLWTAKGSVENDPLKDLPTACILHYLVYFDGSTLQFLYTENDCPKITPKWNFSMIALHIDIYSAAQNQQ